MFWTPPSIPWLTGVAFLRVCASETLCFAMWTPKLLNSASQKGPDFFHWTPWNWRQNGSQFIVFSCYELHSFFLFNHFPVTWPKNVKIFTKSSEEKAEKIVVFSYLQVPNSAVFTPSVTLPINVNFQSYHVISETNEARFYLTVFAFNNIVCIFNWF